LIDAAFAPKLAQAGALSYDAVTYRACYQRA